jgi:hypothetical protein
MEHLSSESLGPFFLVFLSRRVSFFSVLGALHSDGVFLVWFGLVGWLVG